MSPRTSPSTWPRQVLASASPRIDADIAVRSPVWLRVADTGFVSAFSARNVQGRSLQARG